MFKGAFTAIITPFKNNEVDYDAFAELIEFQIKEGIHGIVPCGTTGESATLSFEEHKEVIKKCVEIVNKRVPIIAGSGSNNTKEAIELTKYAKDVGADGALVITPYYNKPTQEGLYYHFKTIAEEVNIPIVVYNVPGRTGVNLLPDTLAKLKDLSNIAAVKEASGSITQAEEIIIKTEGKLNLLSGDDSLYFPILTIGGTGVISVVSNIIPKDVANVYNEFQSGNMEESRNIFYKYFFLTKSMFYETNPIPAKTSLNLMGKISDELRLPLYKMSDTNKNRLIEDLKKYSLI